MPCEEFFEHLLMSITNDVIGTGANCPDKLAEFIRKMLPAFTLVLWVKFDQK